jgi:hypothetical protein
VCIVIVIQFCLWYVVYVGPLVALLSDWLQVYEGYWDTLDITVGDGTVSCSAIGAKNFLNMVESKFFSSKVGLFRALQ